MNKIIEAATSRSRTVLIAFVVIIAAGISSYYSIPKESEPEIDIPFIYVEVALEGVAPEDAERLLVRPLEQELRTVEGLKEMVSSGGENRATVTLEFQPDADVDKALIDVRERVDLAKSKLPACPLSSKACNVIVAAWSSNVIRSSSLANDQYFVAIAVHSSESSQQINVPPSTKALAIHIEL